MPANLENSAVAAGLEKVSFHSNPKERQCQRMYKLLHNCTHLTHQQSNAQFLQGRLQQYMNRELPDVQAGFRKGIGIRDQIANICWIVEKAREFQKKIYFFSSIFSSLFYYLDFMCKCQHTVFVFFCLTYFTYHNALQVHSCCCKWQHFILFYG